MEMIKDQNPDEEFLEQVRRQTQKVMEEFLTAAKMKPGQDRQVHDHFLPHPGDGQRHGKRAGAFGADR